MLFLLRGIHISFWLFVGWVMLRVWELNFEISPLPAFLLPLFVFLVLFLITFLLSRRLQKRHALDTASVLRATAILVIGAVVWELGLTIYLGGMKGIPAMFTWRLGVGVIMQVLASLLAAKYLRRKAERVMATEMI